MKDDAIDNHQYIDAVVGPQSYQHLNNIILNLEKKISKKITSTNFETIDNFEDYGLISIMYHRFNESKYPSTNIQLDIFKEQLNIIESEKINFIHPKDFVKSLSENKSERKILFTVDDGLLSFYNNAWPILKEKKIPFILFVNTREVGSFNYMSWDQIRELYNYEFVEIGNHSHSHEYLVDESPQVIKNDILKSIRIFEENLEKILNFFISIW